MLALAPGILSNLPRSGDWMNSVKVVGGLIEIGAAFKFLNTAEVSMRGVPEEAWFDAQVLLAAWVVIAAVCGFYLLGFFRTSHDHQEPSVGVGRLLIGSMFLFLALYFTPALFGYPPRSQIYDRLIVGLLPADAGELDAETQLLTRLEQFGMMSPGGGGSGAEERPLIADSEDPEEVQRARSLHGVWWDMSYDVALAKAKESNKPVLIDFTGVNCANCRLMEKSVMPRNDVIERLRNFETVQLYVDRVPIEGLGPERSEDLAVRNFEREIELTQESTQPLYVVMTPEGKVLSSQGGYIEPKQFLSYLDTRPGQIRRGRPHHTDGRVNRTESTHKTTGPGTSTVPGPACLSDRSINKMWNPFARWIKSARVDCPRVWDALALFRSAISPPASVFRYQPSGICFPKSAISHLDPSSAISPPPSASAISPPPSALRPLPPRLLLRDPADPEPSAELGLDLGPVQVPSAKHHQRMKNEIGHLPDEMCAALVAGLVGRLDHLRCLLGDLARDLGHPPLKQRNNIRPLGGRIRLAIGDKLGKGVHHVRLIGHDRGSVSAEFSCKTRSYPTNAPNDPGSPFLLQVSR